MKNARVAVVKTSALVILLALPFSAAAQGPPPDTGVVSGTIQLHPEQKKKSIVLFSEGSDLTKATTDAKVTVEDITGDGVTVQFDNFRLITREPQVVNGVSSTKRIEWSADATVVAGLPAETTTNRSAALVVTAGTAELGRRRLAYVLSNRAAGAAAVTWTMTGPGDTLMVPPNDHAAFFLSATGGPAKVTGLRSTLKDAATAEKFPEAALRVCARPSITNCVEPALAPGAPTRLYLVVDECELKKAGIYAGSFTGAIDVALDHAIDTKSFNLTIHRSSWWLKLVGILVILLGVLVSLLATMVLRNGAARAEGLIPVEMLRETIAKFAARLASCGRTRDNSPETFAALERVQDALATKNIVNAGYIPRWISNPFQPPAAVTGYAEFLQKHADRLTVLRHLIDYGHCTIATLRKDNPGSQHDAPFREAFEQVDRLARNDAETRATLDPKLATIETALREKIKARVGKTAADRAAARAAAERTPAEQLAVRLQIINAGVWVLVAVATTILGYVVVIAPTFGFGTGPDLAKAFLWGLAIQTAGQSLQSLTPGTVTTAFGVQVPK